MAFKSLMLSERTQTQKTCCMTPFTLNSRKGKIMVMESRATVPRSLRSDYKRT